jgi:hypothetical protein
VPRVWGQLSRDGVVEASQKQRKHGEIWQGALCIVCKSHGHGNVTGILRIGMLLAKSNQFFFTVANILDESIPSCEECKVLRISLLPNGPTFECCEWSCETTCSGPIDNASLILGQPRPMHCATPRASVVVSWRVYIGQVGGILCTIPLK